MNPSERTLLPLLPLRASVLLPGTTMTFTVGRPKSLALVQSLSSGQVFGVVAQADGQVEDPDAADLRPVGTYARLLSTKRSTRDALRITVEAIGRFRLDDLAESEPFLRGVVSKFEEKGDASKEAEVLRDELIRLLGEVGAKGGAFEALLAEPPAPGAFADKATSLLGLDTEQAISVLEADDVPERLRKVIGALVAQRELAELRNKIGNDVRKEIGKHQREAILREQLRAIKKELGEDAAADGDALKQKLDAKDLPEDVRKVVDRELSRLDQTGGQGAEANVIRTYLEWIAALPFSERAKVSEDIDAIAQKLDDDHTGLDDVKKRILEHMAVRKLSRSEKGTILCLVGPPGVGKTSLGQSIADATGRPFVRVSLGGVRDEAEIRGHRRTYVGALPGRLLHALRKVQAKNPLILLDEIDKVSNAWGGAAESALLEVLDPEQNKAFTDHYLELPFDLSEVMFVCTANTLETLSPPLRDRLEIVELAGYTLQEKLGIAKKHLVQKRIKESGIPEGALQIQDEALGTLISDYTREAGVRQLDREIGRIARSVALDVARKPEGETHVLVDVDEVRRILGKQKFKNDVAERTSLPGVATGLAWTPVGGDILFIETSRMKGKGRLEITGQLGDVMKESARAALTYVRSHADDLGIDKELFEEVDIHIHVPAGAVPKDGPSAGVTMFTALASLFAGQRVRPDTAMTGECTLRGRVLPVGGIKSKVLAAHRAGIKRVILPKDNARDVDDVPEEVRNDLELVLAGDMREVLQAALEPIGAMLDGSGSGEGRPLEA